MGEMDECAIELDFHVKLTLTISAYVYPLFVSSVFCSDFYNVNHMLCPCPDSHFCSVWVYDSTYS